jgi:cysteine-rich motor neuron 1 protein
MLYNNSQKWNEDDCTQCQCENGKISCTVEFCKALNCDNQVYVSGQCCPICKTYVCNLFCPYGYKKDNFGKDNCECNVCPNIKDCHKNCRFGFKKNEYGCDICECFYYENLSTDKACILANGTIYENGHIWLESKCHHCFCNNGKIVCTSPHCPKLNCYHQVIHDNQCCPSCSVPQSSEFYSFYDALR